MILQKKKRAIINPANFTFSGGNGSPRIEFNPMLGVWVEEGTTNLVPADFTLWSGGSYSVGGQLDLFGGNNAFLLNDNNPSSNVSLMKTNTVANDNSTYTFSVYLKPGTALQSQVSLAFAGGTLISKDCVITWNTKSITNGGIITDLGNGWYKVTVSSQNNSSGNISLVTYVYPAAWSSGGTTTGNVYAFRPQLEAKPYATSYTPTTRAAEVLTVAVNDGVQRENMIPPFSNPRWIKHANTVVGSDPYTLTLNATATWNNNDIIINVTPNNPYTISCSSNGGRVRIYNDISGTTFLTGSDPNGSYTSTFTPTVSQILVRLASPSAGTFTFANPQLELGNVQTSFQPYGARLAPSEGTIEVLCRIDAVTKRQGATSAFLFNVTRTGGNAFNLYHSLNSTEWYARSISTSGTTYSAAMPDTLTLDGINSFAVAWNVSVFENDINGTLKSSISNPYLPADLLDFCLGNLGSNYANTVFLDVCFSSIKRTQADRTARAQFAQTHGYFPRDQYTTYQLKQLRTKYV